MSEIPTQKRSVPARLKGYFGEGFPVREEGESLRGYVVRSFALMPTGLRRLLRLQPVLALGSAVVGILLMRAGYGYAPVAAGLLCACLLYLLLRLPAPTLSKRATLWRLSDYALQIALANVLLFVSPFYFESSLLPSRHILFLLAIVALTLIAGVDWLYIRVAQRHPLRAACYHGLVFFVALNFIFPVLLGLRNATSLWLAAALSFGLMTGAAYRHRHHTRRGLVWIVLGGLLVLGGASLGRSVIPPAPLKLITATPCLAVSGREARHVFDSLPLAKARVVMLHTSIFAPLGIDEGLVHRWLHDGKEITQLPAGTLRGGRREGFRAWTRHRLRAGAGDYRVEIWTESGQLLGEGAFTITP